MKQRYTSTPELAFSHLDQTGPAPTGGAGGGDSINIYVRRIYIYHWRRKRGGGGGGGQGGHVPPHFFAWGGAMVCLCPPLFTPHFYFSLELYVYIKLINNYLAFFIYQIIILWTISINWHRWLLVNNHISKYNSFILVLYRRYINYVSVCPPPPPPPPPTFWHLPTPLYIYIYIYIYMCVCVCVCVCVKQVFSFYIKIKVQIMLFIYVLNLKHCCVHH